MNECVFCGILSAKQPASFIYRDDVCAAFMDIEPINHGHLLVIPNQHATYLADLDQDIGAHLFRIAQHLASALRASGVRCEGVNLFLADGKAAGQEVFHTHLHVFPRYKGDGFGLRFGPNYHNRPDRLELEQLAKKIRTAGDSNDNDQPRKEQPSITTERLILRPFTLADAPDVQCLAGDRAVADTTQAIPHPYEDGMAEVWISTHQPRFEKGELAVFAITLKTNGSLIGTVGLTINPVHSRAELGYWVGKAYWKRGYCTEAAVAVVRYGFDVLGLNRIYAHHLSRNPASGRVMAKIGMQHEGTLRKNVIKWGVFEDVETWGRLRDDSGTVRSEAYK
jgi:RimJ/RimL family protein N-acetyltransferase/diadenosine tetraphosphate (Ap4A) HIT family hydrolase